MFALVFGSVTGCYSFKTSVRHGLFLDRAYEEDMTVMVGFRIGATYHTPLTTVADMETVKSKIRYQIRSNLHPGSSSLEPIALQRHSVFERAEYLPSLLFVTEFVLSCRVVDCGERN